MKTEIYTDQKELGMDHQSILAPLMKSIEIPLSEYCFANLYFFRNTHQYKLISEDRDTFLSGISYDGKRYLMPLRDLKENPDYLQKIMIIGQKEGYDMLFPIPESWLPLFDKFSLASDYLEQDSDYLYASEKMQNYPGRNLHKKRNLLKQYCQNYKACLKPLTEENVHEPLELLDIWQAASTQEMCDSDYYQCRDALFHRDYFDLKGAVFYADDSPVGFMIGEAVSSEVFTIHFAKGDVSVKGVYQYMFNSFAKEFCKDFNYINLEQDLGIEGLRRTKRSYLPDQMAHKYRIHLK